MKLISASSGCASVLRCLHSVSMLMLCCRLHDRDDGHGCLTPARGSAGKPAGRLRCTEARDPGGHLCPRRRGTPHRQSWRWHGAAEGHGERCACNEKCSHERDLQKRSQGRMPAALIRSTHIPGAAGIPREAPCIGIKPQIASEWHASGRHITSYTPECLGCTAAWQGSSSSDSSPVACHSTMRLWKPHPTYQGRPRALLRSTAWVETLCNPSIEMMFSCCRRITARAPPRLKLELDLPHCSYAIFDMASLHTQEVIFQHRL